MSQLTYDKFCSLVAELAEGRDTKDIVAEIRSSHAEYLTSITTYIVDNAITNIVRNLRRRNATLRISGGVDLFSGHSVPSLTTKDSVDLKGRIRRVNVRTEHLTKAELRAKVDELRARPPRKNKTLRDYESLLIDIESHCADDETVETGLLRARKGG